MVKKKRVERTGWQVKGKCWSRFFDQPAWFYNGNDTIKRKTILEKKRRIARAYLEYESG